MTQKYKLDFHLLCNPHKLSGIFKNMICYAILH